RDKAEIRKRGVPSADVGRIGEDPAKAAVLGEPFQRRPGVGDRGKLLPSLALPTAWGGDLAYLVPEVGEVRQRFRRLSGLGGDDEQSCPQPDLRPHAQDGRGVGGVQEV